MKCLEAADAHKEAGNVLLRNGDAAGALVAYEAGFRALHILVVGRQRDVFGDAFFDTPLPPSSRFAQVNPGGFGGSGNAGMARMVLRVTLVANTVQALLTLRRWDDAHYWGMRSIRLMREALGDGEFDGLDADAPRPLMPAASLWGKVYYRTGLAARELGKEDEARALIRTAGRWLPGDRIVQREVAACALKLG